MTLVISVKPGHDGTLAVVRDGILIRSVEAEKDSGRRYADPGVTTILNALSLAPDAPDVLAVSGWHRWVEDHVNPVGAGYFGVKRGTYRELNVMGHHLRAFTSSHERSHLMCSIGLYPGQLPESFAALVWEGRIGSLYEVKDNGLSARAVPVLDHPGGKYAALMTLADETFPGRANPHHEYAGKLMALTAFGDAAATEEEDRDVVERLLSEQTLFPFDKAAYAGEYLYGCGIFDRRFHNAAKFLSNRIFEMFSAKAATLFAEPMPLLVSGGCGLNCDWNAAWVQSGIFSEVFVPPCANDSGSAIGTAIDALVHLGEDPRLIWSVDAGDEFTVDVAPAPERWESTPYCAQTLATALKEGRVAAWVNGCYEIGPRALGRRSLLASGDLAKNRGVLNAIKRRESYRPIAPMCRVEDFATYFDGAGDPYMLYFARVKDDRLSAVTHVDGTARVQVVHRKDNEPIHELLGAVAAQGRPPVLCNTSLNFNGYGFINRQSDLFRYCEQTGIDDVVVDTIYYRRRRPAGSSE